MIESERSIKPYYRPEEEGEANGDLENYLLTLVEDANLPNYNTLPQQITSTNVEHYANWMSSFCVEHPEYKELGAYIHLRKEPTRRLIIPVRPNVGDEDVTPAFARKRKDILPVALAHNHITPGCFSQPPGHDMECVINGYNDQGERIQVPAWVLATPDDNFLILRTKETTNQDRWRLYEISYNAVDQQTMREFRRHSTKFGELSRERFWDLFARTEELYFGGKHGFYSFYQSYLGTFQIAQECKLGFYHSNKDGIYSQIFMPDLLNIMRLRYEQALSKAFAQMHS